MAEAVVLSVALAVATEAAKAIGQLLLDRVITEINLAWGLEDDLEKLKTKILNLQLFFTDLGNVKHVDKRGQVIEWLVKVKDAAYVADNIIDDCHYEIIRRQHKKKKKLTEKLKEYINDLEMTKKLTKKLKEFVHDPEKKEKLAKKFKEFFRHNMSHRVRDVLDTFGELDKEARGMGLKQLQITADGITGTSADKDEGRDKLSQARQHAAANDAEFVGRKDEMKKLLQILCQPSDKEAHISTVAILGIGGLGKTTFARRLSKSKDVEAHFGTKFWISVRNDFSIDRILKEMLEYVPSKNGNMTNTKAMKDELREYLKSEKYLLVLDDVWCDDQESWSNLKNALEEIGGLPGCVILFTTRLLVVTTRSQAVYTHLLKELSEEEGWALLKQRVLLGGTSPSFSSLEESGKKIVAKCKYVPLAIKAIGGILKLMQFRSEWQLIENSEIWDWPQNEENQILPSLRLTFNHLPNPVLKQCFAYCAAFCRKGNLMKKDELVSIWLAQGFLHGSAIENLTMEELGEKFLRDLGNYSLLDEVKGGYKMHDLVYDLAVDVSGGDLLIWKSKDHYKINSCRHLVIDKENVEALSTFSMNDTLSKLRTISHGLPHDVLAQAKYLRTLAVDGCGTEDLPSSTSLPKHLRFLSVSNSPIETLPDSIEELYLLETVRLLDCYRMKVLPAKLYSLTDLIHIPTTTPMLASRGLQELTKLRTLPRLALSDDEDGWSIDELGGLQNLMGEVHISGLEHVKTKENATKADLAGKAKVSHITLAWAEKREEITGGSYNDEHVLDGLQPHPDIKSLELQNFFGAFFPRWMGVVSEGGSPLLLNNLTSLKLLNCSRCQMLPTLGHLPYLNYLVLSGLKVKSIGYDFYVAPLSESNSKVNRESFPSLTELEISDFKSLETWALPSTGEETKVFPLLVVIKLTGCPELETIPALDYFKSLKTLQLTNVGIKSLDIKKHRPSPMLSPEVIDTESESSKITKQNPSCMVLETLEICYCKKLESVPSELKFAASLKTLKVNDCPALTSLPDDLFDGLISLSELLIYRCEALNNIPTSLEKCGSLAALKIEDCPSLEGKMPNFRKLQGLRKLYKSGNHVTFMKSMLKEVEHLPNLTTLIIGGFSNEKDQESYFSDVSPIQKNQSLTNLYLVGSPNIKSLPEQLQLLTGIKVLGIYKNLKNFPHGWVVFHLSRTYG